MVRLTPLPTAVAARPAPAQSTSTAPATAPSAATTTAAATVEGSTAAHDRVTGRGGTAGVLPKHLADDVALLSSAGQHALTRLFVLRGGDPAVAAAMIEALEDPSLWCVPMRPNDEARVLAKAIECVPLSTTLAKQPSPPIARIDAIDAVTDGRTAVNNALGLVHAAWAKGGDVVVAPEWLFVPAHGVAMTATAKDVLLDTLAMLTRGSDRLLVPGTLPWVDDVGGYHNTAFAFSDGKVLHSVDKRGDGEDVEIAKRAGLTHVSEPGVSTFAWRDVVVGLEVCRDHGDARLRYELLGSGRDVVDLQVVVSSGVWLRHAAVGVGGAVVVAQGDGIAGHERGTRDATGRLHVDTLLS